MATTKITSREDAMRAYHVTSEQLSKCQAVQDGTNGKWFYLVESASKSGVEYKVVYNTELKALQCLPFDGGPTCEASAAGIGCFHKRAALCAHAIYRLEQKAQAARMEENREQEATRPVSESEEQAMIERLVAQGWSREAATRIAYSKGQDPKVRGNLNYNPEFRLLK